MWARTWHSAAGASLCRPTKRPPSRLRSLLSLQEVGRSRAKTQWRTRYGVSPSAALRGRSSDPRRPSTSTTHVVSIRCTTRKGLRLWCLQRPDHRQRLNPLHYAEGPQTVRFVRRQAERQRVSIRCTTRKVFRLVPVGIVGAKFYVSIRCTTRKVFRPDHGEKLRRRPRASQCAALRGRSSDGAGLSGNLDGLSQSAALRGRSSDEAKTIDCSTKSLNPLHYAEGLQTAVRPNR